MSTDVHTEAEKLAAAILYRRGIKCRVNGNHTGPECQNCGTK